MNGYTRRNDKERRFPCALAAMGLAICAPAGLSADGTPTGSAEAAPPSLQPARATVWPSAEQSAAIAADGTITLLPEPRGLVADLNIDPGIERRALVLFPLTDIRQRGTPACAELRLRVSGVCGTADSLLVFPFATDGTIGLADYRSSGAPLDISVSQPGTYSINVTEGLAAAAAEQAATHAGFLIACGASPARFEIHARCNAPPGVTETIPLLRVEFSDG